MRRCRAVQHAVHLAHEAVDVVGVDQGFPVPEAAADFRRCIAQPLQRALIEARPLLGQRDAPAAGEGGAGGRPRRLDRRHRHGGGRYGRGRLRIGRRACARAVHQRGQCRCRQIFQHDRVGQPGAQRLHQLRAVPEARLCAQHPDHPQARRGGAQARQQLRQRQGAGEGNEAAVGGGHRGRPPGGVGLGDHDLGTGSGERAQQAAQQLRFQRIITGEQYARHVACGNERHVSCSLAVSRR
jgi:hypothetical protein